MTCAGWATGVASSEAAGSITPCRFNAVVSAHARAAGESGSRMTGPSFKLEQSRSSGWIGAPGVRRRWGRYRSNTAVSRQTPSEPIQKQRFARRSGLIQTQTSAYDLLLRSNGKSSMRIGLPGLWWYRAFANRADGMLSIRSFTHCLSRCISKVTGFIAFWLPASTIVAISVGPST